LKKVLLCAIDGWTSRIFVPALEEGRLPNFKALTQAGYLNLNCVSIFPSITPAALASIVTGRYPAGHGLAGAYWYDADTEDVMYFGDDIWVVFNRGMNDFIRDFLNKLNHQYLKAETLCQRVEREGLKGACLNYLVFRGDVRHKLRIPLPLRLLDFIPGVSFPRSVLGPSIMVLGDFVSSGIDLSGGLTGRFGFEDDCTIDALVQLIENKSLPDFTVAYFPSYDKLGHDVGPDEAISELEHLDQRLGEVFQAFGGMKQMLEEVCLVMTADHSMSSIIHEEESAIRLDVGLTGFQLADAGDPWKEGDQLKVCPNLRAAHIYFRRSTPDLLQRVAEQLLPDPRIDQIMWRADLTGKGDRGFRVVTKNRGSLLFWKGADGDETARDHYGCTWSWQGDLGTIDAQVSEENVILSESYPNAFERIASILNLEDSGHLIVTAWPGYEFKLPRTSVHDGGGSHGSLHALDSVMPLLIAGAPDGTEFPPYPRTVDVAPICLDILGLESEKSVGVSHVD
jgi:hypothetical protein